MAVGSHQSARTNKWEKVRLQALRMNVREALRILLECLFELVNIFTNSQFQNI
jgi:hypothetical protein